jgi:hypothetical protein
MAKLDYGVSSPSKTKMRLSEKLSLSYSPGLLCMIPPSAKTVVAVM